MAIAYGNGSLLWSKSHAERASGTGTGRHWQLAQILGISQSLVVSSAPPLGGPLASPADPLGGQFHEKDGHTIFSDLSVEFRVPLVVFSGSKLIHLVFLIKANKKRTTTRRYKLRNNFSQFS